MAPQTQTATVPKVSIEAMGTGVDARRVIRAGGWELSIWNDVKGVTEGEPLVRDTDAATRLGFSQPRDVRKLIERVWPENKRPLSRATVARQSVGRGGKGVREYTLNEYWLTEAEVLKLCARSETPVAESILDEMIAVYMAVRRGLLAPVAPVEKPAPKPPVDPEIHTRLSIAVSEATYNALDAAGRVLNVAPAQIAAFVLTSWRYQALTLVPGAVMAAAQGAVVEAYAGLGTPSRKIVEENDRGAALCQRAQNAQNLQTGLQPIAQAPVVPTPVPPVAPPAQPVKRGRGRPRKLDLPAPSPQPVQPVTYHPLPTGPVLTPRPSILTHGGAFHVALLDAWEALCADGYGRSATQAITTLQAGRAPAGLKHVADMLKGARIKLIPSTFGKVLSRFRRVEVGGRWLDVTHTKDAQVWTVERAQ